MSELTSPRADNATCLSNSHECCSLCSVVRRAVQGGHDRRRVRGRRRERARGDDALGRVGRGERRGRVAGPGDKLQQIKCELLSREAKQFTGVEGSM